MNHGSLFGRFFSRIAGAGAALAIAALVGSSTPALAKARIVAILPLDAGVTTKGAAEHYTDSIVSRLAAYPGYDAVRLNAGQEPQESAAKIGADVYVVGEFDKKGDVLTISLESFSVTTNQFLGNLVVSATDLDVPATIDFTPLFGKSAGATSTPAPLQSIDPIAMQSAATPPASLEASPEPTASRAPQPKAQPQQKIERKPARPQQRDTRQNMKPQPKATAKLKPRPTPSPRPSARPTARPTTTPQRRQSPNRNTNTPHGPARAPQARQPAPRPNDKPKVVAPLPTPTVEPTPVPTPIPSPAPLATSASTALTNMRAFTLIPLQSPDGDSITKRDPLLDQSTLDLSRRFAASRYSISIGPTKDRDEASRDAATLCRDSSSAGVIVGTMKYDLKKAGLNRLINKNATDAITRVDIRLTLLDCAGKFVWKGQSVKNLADIPKPASGDPDAVEAAITELVALFETRT